MSAMSGGNQEHPMDATDLDSALRDTITNDAEVTRPTRLYHSRKKQKQFFGDNPFVAEAPVDAMEIPRSSLGVLNDRETMAVPGSVIMFKTGPYNKPLGISNMPRRTSHSTIPIPTETEDLMEEEATREKTTESGVILVPQPDETGNDPLNWPTWKRDCALISVGLYCAVGGGMTPILAAGFNDVAVEYNVPVENVSLTTGLYMLGMGLGSVVWSPTAILWGKRPVYLASVVMFLLSNVWCSTAKTFSSLIVARIFQGFAISPVECLPSATVAEIYFLHERAFRLGIYTLLLLGGKNLVPLLSAAIISTLGWHWVFWIVAMFTAVCGVLIVCFVPETFWDREPIPKKEPTRERQLIFNTNFYDKYLGQGVRGPPQSSSITGIAPSRRPTHPIRSPSAQTGRHVEFALPNGHKTAHHNEKESEKEIEKDLDSAATTPVEAGHVELAPAVAEKQADTKVEGLAAPAEPMRPPYYIPNLQYGYKYPLEGHRRSLSEPVKRLEPVVREHEPAIPPEWSRDPPWLHKARSPSPAPSSDYSLSAQGTLTHGMLYTNARRQQPTLSFTEQLKPFHGRLNSDQWLKVAVRPFILLSYPAVAFSSLIYACSVGWLIVISESVAMIYRGNYYHFNALSTGLVYIGPFIGGVLGTAVAGKLSDVIVKAMSRRNHGLYEPEFRLVMMIPVAITTGIGLIGFGWSAQDHDAWIVPTVFFSLVSFGCALGSTTSITFVVDSYRQYAGEALVTLNFCKNVLHGLVFSLFVTHWLEADGSKTVYIWVGVMQMIATLSSIPMYLYGKRMRMWTVRANFMERF